MDYKKLLPKRQQNSHKGTFGKILNIAGSQNFQGAAFLSSISALKIGAGYIMLACPENILNNIASLSPDITFLPLVDSPLENIGLLQKNIDKFDVISIGCGIGSQKRTLVLFEKLLKILSKSDTPVIIDADGLNAISVLQIEKLPPKTIITPHEVELARLLNVEVNEISENRIKYAKVAGKKFNCTTVLKGHNTLICDSSGNLSINNSGNSALAKAGSGDVLAGMVAGLLAQGCALADAAVLGVYLHGLSGELASQKLSEYSTLASDLLEFIPQAINKTLQNSNFSD